MRKSEPDYYYQNLNVYELPDKLPNNLQFRTLGYEEIQGRSQNVDRYSLVPRLSSKKKKLVITLQNCIKSAIELSLNGSTLSTYFCKFVPKLKFITKLDPYSLKFEFSVTFSIFQAFSSVKNDIQCNRDVTNNHI